MVVSVWRLVKTFDCVFVVWPVHGVILSFLGPFTLRSCIIAGAELHLLFEWCFLIAGFF
jgi:hypothetical protein